jgi:glycosyltransferase involved in cell wall biosynthesis
VRRLVERGHAVCVVAPADDEATERDPILGGARVERVRYLPRRLRRLPYGYGGIPVHLRDHPARILEVPFLLLAMAVRTLRDAPRFDLVHANWLFTAIAALPARLLARRPLVVTLRGSDMALAEANAWTRALARFVLARADAIAPVSRDLRERAAKLGADPSRLEVVADGAETEGFPTRDEARAELGLGEASRLVLFVGNLIPVKGIDVLIEATARMRASERCTTVLLVGGGDVEGYRRLAEERGLDESALRFLGFRPTHEIPTWLAACDVFCLPSRSEGLPNALLEAMGAARAVVVTRVGGMPDLVEDGRSGLLVDAEDAGALAGALGALVDDPRRCSDMGARGRAILGEQRLTWQATAQRYEEIYTQVLPTTARPPAGAGNPR